MSTWRVPEVIHLLELFTRNDLWDNRALELEKSFGKNHPSGFFTVQNCKRELHRVFSQPNPEHVNGLPTHPRSKEAAELWLTYYKNKLLNEQEQAKQMFWVGIRQILDIIQKFKLNNFKADTLVQLRDQQRDINASLELEEKKDFENCVNMFIKQAHADDLLNIFSPDDLLKFVRGERIPLHESPIKIIAKSPRSFLPSSPTSTITGLSSITRIIDESHAEIDADFEIVNNFENCFVEALVAKNKSMILKNIVTPSVLVAPPTKKRKLEKQPETPNVKLEQNLSTINERSTRLRRSTTSSQSTPDAARLDAKAANSTNKSDTKQFNTKNEKFFSLFKNSKDEPKKQTLTPTDQRPTRLRRSNASTPFASVQTPIESNQNETPKINVSAEPKHVSPISKKEKKNLNAKKIITEKDDAKDTSLTLSDQRLTRSRRSNATAVIPINNQLASDLARPDLIKTDLKQSKTKALSVEKGHSSIRLRRSNVASASQPVLLLLELKSAETSKGAPCTAATTIPISAESKSVVPFSEEYSKSVSSKNIASDKDTLKQALSTSAVRSRRTGTTSEEPGFVKRVYNSLELVNKSVLLPVYNKILALKYSNIFYYPVSESDVPGYHEAVKSPMNLITLKKSIESGTIETFAQFTDAVVMMFANAIMFNSTDHDVNVAAKKLLQQSLKLIMEAQYPFGEFGDTIRLEQFDLLQTK